MPKIVRNEIEYSSTTSTANQINYLNTTSGLSATNVQGAIDEVTSDLATKQNILSGSRQYVTAIISPQPSSNNNYYSSSIYVGVKTPTVSLINYPGNPTDLKSDFTMFKSGEWMAVYTSKNTYAGRPIQISFTLA